MKHLKIVSNGRSLTGTRILDSETGEDLTSVLMVHKVTWVHEAGEMPRVILECLASAADVEGEAEAP